MRKTAAERLASLADLIDSDGRFIINRDAGRHFVHVGTVSTDGCTTFDAAVDDAVEKATAQTWEAINRARSDIRNLETRANALERLK